MNQRCTECNGTGGCKVCKGSGREGYSGKGRPLNSKECPQCYGTGVCQVCGGTGGSAVAGDTPMGQMGSSRQVRRT